MDHIVTRAGSSIAALERRVRALTSTRAGGWRSPLAMIFQLLASTAILVGVLAAYFLQAAVGAGSLGDVRAVAPLSPPSWSLLLEEARSLDRMIVAGITDSRSNATTEQWKPQIQALVHDLDQLTASTALETGPALEAQRQALGKLATEASETSPEITVLVFDDLIGVFEDLASTERAARMTTLEGAAVDAIRELGTRALSVALTAVAAATGLVGLGMSVGGLRSERARSRNRP